jgi:membrane-anchored protein YejM (alkaline phosphatase superfamily)
MWEPIVVFVGIPLLMLIGFVFSVWYQSRPRKNIRTMLERVMRNDDRRK